MLENARHVYVSNCPNYSPALLPSPLEPRNRFLFNALQLFTMYSKATGTGNMDSIPSTILGMDTLEWELLIKENLHPNSKYPSIVFNEYELSLINDILSNNEHLTIRTLIMRLIPENLDVNPSLPSMCLSMLIPGLSTTRTLKKLQLSFLEIGDGKCSNILSQILLENQSLEELVLKVSGSLHTRSISEAIGIHPRLYMLTIKTSSLHPVNHAITDLFVNLLRSRIQKFVCQGVENITRLDWKGFEQVLEDRVSSTMLNFIDFRNTVIPKKSLVSLCTYLNTKQTFPYDLILTNIGLQSQGAKILFRSVTWNARLHHLDLSESTLGDAGCKALAYALSHCTAVKQVVLSSCEIGNVGLERLSECLGTCIEYLDLSMNTFDAEGAYHLCKNYLDSKGLYLNYLNLSHNKLGSYGVKYVLNSISSNDSLGVRVLNLNDTGIGVKALYALASFIGTLQLKTKTLKISNSSLEDFTTLSMVVDSLLGSHLRVVQLRGWDLGSRGYRSLAQGLLSNGGLVELGLSSTRPGFDGLELLGRALSRNSSLRVLDISRNEQSLNDSFEPFMNGLRENTGLHCIDLRENGLSDEQVWDIIELVEINPRLTEVHVNIVAQKDKRHRRRTHPMSPHQRHRRKGDAKDKHKWRKKGRRRSSNSQEELVITPNYLQNNLLVSKLEQNNCDQDLKFLFVSASKCGMTQFFEDYLFTLDVVKMIFNYIPSENLYNIPALWQQDTHYNINSFKNKN